MEYLKEILKEYPNIWIMIGTVFAALVVMYSGYLNLRISRTHIVSGYRQEWINNVREKFSDFLDEFERVLSDLEHRNIDDVYQHQYPTESRALIYRLYTLRLFLNPNESKHIMLIDKANDLQNTMLYKPVDQIYFECLRNDKLALVVLFQDILKDEWNRVKLGEFKWKWRKRMQCLIGWVRPSKKNG